MRVDRRGPELGGGSRLGARGGWRRSRKVWRAPHAKLSHRDELDTPYRVDWWRLGASAPRLVGVVASAAPLEATDRSWKWPNRVQPISELVSGPAGHVCTGLVGSSGFRAAASPKRILGLCAAGGAATLASDAAASRQGPAAQGRRRGRRRLCRHRQRLPYLCHHQAGMCSGQHRFSTAKGARCARGKPPSDSFLSLRSSQIRPGLEAWAFAHPGLDR